MSKEAFDKIMAGLDDALAYAKGDKSRGREWSVSRRPGEAPTHASLHDRPSVDVPREGVPDRLSDRT